MINHSRFDARGRLVALALAAATLLLSACASTMPKEDREVVERAQARWDAIAAGDLETAYTYYSPGYRSSTSVIEFGVEMLNRKVKYTSAEYMDHECEGARCTVRFSVGFRVFAPVPGMTKYDGRQVVEDTWINTRGEWWYLPEK